MENALHFSQNNKKATLFHFQKKNRKTKYLRVFCSQKTQKRIVLYSSQWTVIEQVSHIFEKSIKEYPSTIQIFLCKTKIHRARNRQPPTASTIGPIMFVKKRNDPMKRAIERNNTYTSIARLLHPFFCK